MQYKNNSKIIIDKRKLEILIRLNCPDDVLLSVIKTGKFKKTGDDLIDEILETFIDVKEFKNWGGNHNPKGINGCNKTKNRGQVDQQGDQQDDSQNGGQVVDKDIDIDKDKDNKFNNKFLNNKKEKEKNKKEKEDEFLEEVKDSPIYDAFRLWLDYKKERGQTYKLIGLKGAFAKLQKFSNGNELIAKDIINEAISNNWSGFFAKKAIEPRKTHAEEVDEHNLKHIKELFGVDF